MAPPFPTDQNHLPPSSAGGKVNLRNLQRQQLSDWLAAQGEAPFRGRQLFAWLYRSGVTDFSEMTDLSKDLRQTLTEKAYFAGLVIDQIQQSKDGTRKYCFRLDDDTLIESVLIPDQGRNTLCISSQAGCAMACQFCQTGAMGFKRQLTVAEIVGQLLAVQDDISPESVHNLVFMGMGEPLANLDNLLSSLSIITDELGLNFSGKRITVSTCGLVPQMAVLGQHAKVKLAISLHAADDELRSRLMPINKRYPLQQLMAACQAYPLAKRDRITFEYILLAGVNDGAPQARALAKLLRNIPCKINLLPYNKAEANDFHRPTDQVVFNFQAILKKAGYTVLIRSSRGDDIAAACGQLAGQLQGETGAP